MIKLLLFFLLACLKGQAYEPVLRSDIESLFRNIGPVTIQWSSSQTNQVAFQCHKSGFKFIVNSLEQEKVSTLYYGLHKIGFLFPHPKTSIVPTNSEIKKQCEKTFVFNPVFEKRGFHFHTQHPNEWVNGFLLGDERVIESTIVWLARNFQNTFTFVLLRTITLNDMTFLKKAYDLSQKYQIHMGLALSLSSRQQKSYALIPFFPAVTGLFSNYFLRKNIKKLSSAIPFDFLSLEMGTSEFTPTPYKKTLSWLNTVQKELNPKKAFVKIHVSQGQTSGDLGNYNFLPQYADKDIGVLPHTVMYYALDEFSPVYGRKDYKDIYDFTIEQSTKRETWYFPETSYWVGMDQDVPLFLTDYLVARSKDITLLKNKNITGHLTFTSGQEMGYWLMDWSVALMSIEEYSSDYLIALKLLNEDIPTWKSIFDFQTKYIKEKQILPLVSSSNLMDELPFFNHRIHARNTLKELKNNSILLTHEIELLQEAYNNRPSTKNIKNTELQSLIDIFNLRIEHSLKIRECLLRGSCERDSIQTIRIQALNLINKNKHLLIKYPELKTHLKHINPTSYQYGYVWPAANLHFWEREEEQVFNKNYNPFFKNIYNPFKIIF